MRGKVARIQINDIAIRRVEEVINKSPRGLIWDIGMIRAEVRRDITRMLAYSAIKINANLPALYSTLKPDTSSDSPSGRSNGVRFVSARRVINHIKEVGRRRRSFGVWVDWARWIKS